jgi:hypothetical protein
VGRWLVAPVPPLSCLIERYARITYGTTEKQSDNVAPS